MAKSKLTPKVQDTIVEALKAGNYRTVAAQLAGINERSLYRWLMRGEKEDKGIYRKFLEATQEAEALGEAELIAQINVAAKDSWQSAAWILERKHPERWGRKDSLAVNGNFDHSGEVKHNVTETVVLTPELRRLAARFTAAFHREIRDCKCNHDDETVISGQPEDQTKGERHVGKNL